MLSCAECVRTSTTSRICALFGLMQRFRSVLTQGADVLVKVNKITSIKTQLPYEYYSLDYCKPDVIDNVAENLGEVLRGDRIENSPYQARFLVQ